MAYKSDIDNLKKNLEPVEGESVMFRILGSGNNFIEFKGDFFRAVQDELQQRIFLIEAGLDVATALDKFLLHVFESAMVTDVRSRQKEQ